MKQGFVMFLAVLFLSIVIALVQTQATGTVAAAEDGSPVIGALTQLLRFILVFLANQRFVFLICFTVFYKF